MSQVSLTHKIYVIVANSTGLFFSFLGILTYFYIFSVNRSLVNRITIRLQAALSLVDFFSHVQKFFGRNIYSAEVCSFIGFMGNYLFSVYNVIVFFIAFNFHLNILNFKKSNYNKEKYIWFAIILIPILHTLPPYIYGKFGPGNNNFCFIDSKAEYHEIMFYYLFIIPNFIIFLYCLVIIILVAIKIRGVNDILENILDGHEVHDDSKTILEKMFNSWMSRFLMYPIAFLIIRSGLIVDFTSQSFGLVSNILYYWAVSGEFLSGLINYIAFLCDPYFQDAIMDIILFKLGKNHEIKKTRYEIHMDELNFKRQDEALKQYIDSKRKDKIKYLYDKQEARALLRECTDGF